MRLKNMDVTALNFLIKSLDGISDGRRFHGRTDGQEQR